MKKNSKQLTIKVDKELEEIITRRVESLTEEIACCRNRYHEFSSWR